MPALSDFLGDEISVHNGVAEWIIIDCKQASQYNVFFFVLIKLVNRGDN
jgi:hypothetical protein